MPPSASIYDGAELYNPLVLPSFRWLDCGCEGISDSLRVVLGGFDSHGPFSIFFLTSRPCGHMEWWAEVVSGWLCECHERTLRYHRRNVEELGLESWTLRSTLGLSGVEPDCAVVYIVSHNSLQHLTSSLLWLKLLSLSLSRSLMYLLDEEHYV